MSSPTPKASQELLYEGSPRTMLDKLWDSHRVATTPDGDDLVYIDMHLTHEVTTPQPFAALRETQRRVRRPEFTLATADHDVPTDTTVVPAIDTLAGLQLNLQDENCRDFDVPLYGIGDPRQGIVHVIGPELGLSRPGMTIVCGDSHTSTHGAFGALAFGIGTSEVEHVMATQCLRSVKPRAMRVHIVGAPQPETSAKDIALAFLATYGTAIGTGHAIEFCGPVVEAMTMEGRMTLCNMAIEAGARTGMVGPDAVTYQWLIDVAGLSPNVVNAARQDWDGLVSDEGAVFDRDLILDVTDTKPRISWGITPAQSVEVGHPVPAYDAAMPYDQETYERALAYTGYEAGDDLEGTPVATVFIGSCTNGRIEDLRAAAAVLKEQRIADGVRVLVVPGSGKVAQRAEDEGLRLIFESAGCEWRLPGCSMCIAMNADRAPQGTHVASTSNRNFPNRQGPGVTTHLMSPRTAAHCALTGSLATPHGQGGGAL